MSPLSYCLLLLFSSKKISCILQILLEQGYTLLAPIHIMLISFQIYSYLVPEYQEDFFL